MRKPLSKSQIVCITLLWALLCYYVLISVKQIDGPTIVMLLLSAALVFIPVIKSLKSGKTISFSIKSEIKQLK